MKKKTITKAKTLFSKTKAKIITAVFGAMFFMTNTLPVMAANSKGSTTTTTGNTFKVDLGGISADKIITGVKSIAEGIAMILGAGICIFAAFSAVYSFKTEDQEGRNKAMLNFGVGAGLLAFGTVLSFFF